MGQASDSSEAARSDDERLRRAIESTVLGAGVSGPDVEELCREAVESRLRSVCVPPSWVGRAAHVVGQGDVHVVTVANFPFGHGLPAAVRGEARAARGAGADEVDVVFPLHCVPEREWSRAEAVLDAFLEGIGEVAYKLILETAAWSPGELSALLSFVRSRKVPTVKTSTGFHPAGGVTPGAVRTLRRELPAPVRIKASGGIRSRSFALELLDAGADYLGTSSARALLDG